MQNSIVEVSFRGNMVKLYSYHNDIPEVQPGDYVVVESPSGPNCGRVLSTKAKSDKATAWVIARVDLESFKAKQEARAMLE